MNILVVEDDADIQAMVCQSLAQNDYRTLGCSDLQAAKQALARFSPDCLVVDWMLPDGSGIELIRWLRRQQQYRQVPVLMLTARSQESDLITGLDAGADDYLTKPMSLRELNARVKALLRRPAGYQEKLDFISTGPFSINTRSHEVFINDTAVGLTRTEFKLLRFFIESPNKVFSREQILDAVWGMNAYLGDRTVDVHILRLRRLLKAHGVDHMIKTVRGAGYRYSDNPPK